MSPIFLCNCQCRPKVDVREAPCGYAPARYWWAGRDNATLPESISSHANGLKTRRLPPPWPRRTPAPVVLCWGCRGSNARCTLCWAVTLKILKVVVVDTFHQDYHIHPMNTLPLAFHKYCNDPLKTCHPPLTP